MSKPPNELYIEREKRINDCIQCRKPDRVPVYTMFMSFALDYAGYTRKDELYDFDKAVEATVKTTTDLAPDLTSAPMPFGEAMEAIDYTQMKWAGYNNPDNFSYQFVEGEYMKADEYDAFLYDPTDFVVRTYWPRISNKLALFGKMPPLRDMVCYFMGLPVGFAPFANESAAETFEAMRKAGEAGMKFIQAMGEYVQKVTAAGFPISHGSGTETPFDFLGDYFRGTKGLLMDMYRHPEKVTATCEKILPMMLEACVPAAKASGNPRVIIPLHKGNATFMSNEQFKRFYWPTFRQLLVELVNEGLNPVCIVEGNYTPRLDIIKDVPEGKIVYWFEHMDMIKAKEVLGGKVCIMGNVPLSILVNGTPEDVRAYCKQLIDTVGRDGGYIMSSGAVLDEAKPENVKTMIDYTKEYGIL